jgi:hypothetical protein
MPPPHPGRIDVPEGLKAEYSNHAAAGAMGERF